MSAQPCLRMLRRGVSELSTTLWWHVGALPCGRIATDGARDGGAESGET